VNPVQAILIFCLRVYRSTLSPVLSFVFGPNAGCRFTPTCSRYAMDAIGSHGAMAGSWLGLKRICRCHPWGDCGHDPVPETRKAESGKAETTVTKDWNVTTHATRNTQHAATLNSQLSTLNPSAARHGS